MRIKVEALEKVREDLDKISYMLSEFQEHLKVEIDEIEKELIRVGLPLVVERVSDSKENK